MEKGEAGNNKKASVRILQLKNNSYWNSMNVNNKNPLGDYCVLGYFDALDITEAEEADVMSFNTWGSLEDITVTQDNALSCRTLVCVTDQCEKDLEFWKDETEALFFITMIRINKNACAEDVWCKVRNETQNQKMQINYLSYDHSEIIVVTKTNAYNEGIKKVREIRETCGAVKTYTVFAMKESVLSSDTEMQSKIRPANVYCRLHCMVRDYVEAEKFWKTLIAYFEEENDRAVKTRKFETFGGYDWLLEIDDVSVKSVFKCYKMTHSNGCYKKAFFNVESEILVGESENV